jgi:sugar phosphate isomerase/epimerase
MQLAYPLEQFRADFSRHVEFLRNCAVDHIPLYVMLGRAERNQWFGEGAGLDRMAEILREQVAEIRRQGLRIEVIYAGGALAATVLDNAEQQAEWRYLCPLCAELGITQIAAALPNPAREEGDDAWLARLVQGYQWLADAAAEHGLLVSSHHGVDWGRRFYHLQDYEDLFARINRPNCGLLFCFGNVALAEISVPEAIRRLAPWIFAVHVRQVTGSFREGGEEKHLHDGIVDLAACLRALRDIGYEGILHPEHFGKFTTALPSDRRDLWYLTAEPDSPALAWNLAYLRGVMDAVL